MAGFRAGRMGRGLLFWAVKNRQGLFCSGYLTGRRDLFFFDRPDRIDLSGGVDLGLMC